MKFDMKSAKKKVVKFLKDNKWGFVQLAILIVPQVCFAGTYGTDSTISTGIDPLNRPLTVLNSAMTGAIPKVGVTIAAAAAAASYAMGTENQVTKAGLRVAMGGGIAMSAPAAINAITDVSGCLF